MPTVSLYVTGDGTSLVGWNNEGGAPGTYYTYVDDKPTSDGAATALYSPTANDEVTFIHEQLPGGVGTINSVAVHTVVSKLDPVDAFTRMVVRQGGTSYVSAQYTPTATATYEDLVNTWTLNPATGVKWTLSEVNAIEIGIKKTNSAGERVTQIYMVVDYAASATASTIKVRTAAATWVAKPVKWWSGTGWVAKPVKRWSGTGWVTL